MRTESMIKNCVVQCRVSSLKQSQDGESLENQEASLRAFVAKRGWKIGPDGRVWSTAISGRKTDREDFEDIERFIRANPGLVDCYVFKAIDRFTRAGSGEYERMKAELAEYGVEMVDMYGVIQASTNTLEEYGFACDWSRYSPSEITENIMATNAKQEVTTILTRMIGQEIKLTNEGYKMRRPLDGFVNQKVYVDGKKKPIQVPDPERAKFYVAMFELRARGLPDPEIVAAINDMGFRSQTAPRWDSAHKKIIGQTGGRLLTVPQLQRAIQNTGYAGLVCEKWTNYRPNRGKSPGIVTIGRFNQANRGKVTIRENRDGRLELVCGSPSPTGGKKRLKDNPLIPYKFLRCGTCHKELLGSSPRGKSGKRFDTYHCARKHPYVGIKKKTLDEGIETFIGQLNFRPDTLDGLEHVCMRAYKTREQEILRASQEVHANVAAIKAEQAAKLDAIGATKSAPVREKLEQEYEDLEGRVKKADHAQEKMEITEDDIKTFKHEAGKIMEHPAEVLLVPMDMGQRRDLFSLVFGTIPTYEEILNGTPAARCRGGDGRQRDVHGWRGRNPNGLSMVI
jgi:DNA invertase Pin-like site-specific DNA recombinase